MPLPWWLPSPFARVLGLDAVDWGTAVADPPTLPAPDLPQQQLARLDDDRPARPRADSISNAMTGLGTVFDKGVAGRPDLTRQPLTDAELAQLYRLNGYARRIVEFVPFEACRKGWNIVDGSDEQAPLAEDEKRLGLLARVQEAMTWARKDGGAILLLVTEEEADPTFRDATGKPTTEWLKKPLDLERVKALRALVVCSKFEAQPISYQGDIHAENFRHPEIWQVFPQTGGGTETPGSFQVHHSRVVYFPGAKLPPEQRYANGGYDDSILQSLWDAIRAKTTIDQAGAVLAQEFKQSVVKIGGFGAKSTGDQAALVQARLQQMAMSRSVVNTLVLGDGDEYENQSVSLAGWKDLDEQAKATLAAVSGLPQAVLFGEPPGGLNTDGDSHRTLTQNLVSAVQEHGMKDQLVRIYSVLFAARANSGGEPEPDEWDLEFVPLYQMSEKETADLRKTVADTDAIYMDRGVLTPEHVAASRFSDDGYSAETLPVDEAELVLAEGDDPEQAPTDPAAPKKTEPQETP